MTDHKFTIGSITQLTDTGVTQTTDFLGDIRRTAVDVQSQQLEAGIRAKLIELGWTPPGEPVPAQGAQKTQGEILQLLRDIEANVQRAWKDGSLSAKAWPADIGRRLSDAVNAQDAEGTQGAQGAEGVEALAIRIGVYYRAGKVDLGAPLFAFTHKELHEFARRLRNSPQPDVAAEVLRIADEREAGYSRREHAIVVNGRAADAVVALAESLRNSSEIPNGSFISGEVVRIGDDRTGQPRILIHTTREAIMACSENLLGKRVRVVIDAARSAGGDDEA